MERFRIRKGDTFSMVGVVIPQEAPCGVIDGFGVETTIAGRRFQTVRVDGSEVSMDMDTGYIVDLVFDGEKTTEERQGRLG